MPIGVVHLGTGAFHRAHQAVYFDALMDQGEQGWMIHGASLRSSNVASQLKPQDCLFTLTVCDGEVERRKIVGSIKSISVVPEDPSEIIRMLAQPSVSLVTLTITEKGYCLDPANGRFQAGDEGIIHDISNIDAPRTALGILVAGLKARREAGIAPFTVLSCDNLPDNGSLTRRGVVALAHAVDHDLALWIEAEGAFPSSMVDRIVPATTGDDIDELELSVGLRDEAMVKTEPFSQWVVEDRFIGRRPPLERVGVLITNTVAPWEDLKLRLLNGAHSALAYLGGLADYKYVHEAIRAPGFEQFVQRLWDESEATLEPIENFDIAAYRAALIERFRNKSLRHQTRQIAMDGSQKLPQRILNPLRELRQKGQPVPAALTATIAAWMRWQSGVTDNGEAFEVEDPLAETLGIAAQRGVLGFLAIDQIFELELACDLEFVDQLNHAYTQLSSNSVIKALALINSRP